MGKPARGASAGTGPGVRFNVHCVARLAPLLAMVAAIVAACSSCGSTRATESCGGACGGGPPPPLFSTHGTSGFGFTFTVSVAYMYRLAYTVDPSVARASNGCHFRLSLQNQTTRGEHVDRSADATRRLSANSDVMLTPGTWRGSVLADLGCAWAATLTYKLQSPPGAA